jgi:SPP1 gp7 family putative phage head morphogenesis protein
VAITADTLRMVNALRAAQGQLLDSRARTLTAAWVRAWDSLAPALTAGLDDALAAVEAGRPLPRSVVLRTRRLMLSLEATRMQLEQLEQAAEKGAHADVAAAVPPAAAQQADLIGSQLPPSAWHPKDAQPSALDAIVARAQQQITSLARPLSDEAYRAMTRQLIRGIAVGDNPRTVARAMLRGLEGEFNGGLARALTIARTEMLDAQRAAAAAEQWANRDVLAGWQWWTALDNRVCPSCWAQHGNEYPLTLPGPWDHPRGRCTRLPVVKPWKDLGIQADEPPPVGNADGEAVFRALPRADQLQIMGPGRLAALDSGTANWADLSTRVDNPGWRPSYVSTPVRDLGKRAAA